ncbi:hypothetical protein AB0C22_03420 [Micromonospora sp. NPDC048894]|uniref:hypothetical protein n=1 Tax=Micromonospora sp. NPDC048894 TaxID=3155493 RepID=UPI0033F822A2
METAVSGSRIDTCVLEAGDPTVFGALPFLCFHFLTFVVLSIGVGAPRDFMAPSTCNGLSHQASPEPALAHLSALTWNYIRVLSFTITLLLCLLR